MTGPKGRALSVWFPEWNGRMLGRFARELNIPIEVAEKLQSEGFIQVASTERGTTVSIKDDLLQLPEYHDLSHEEIIRALKMFIRMGIE